MANNPNVKKNLRPPWKKGQSGNPKGKPPGAVSMGVEFKKILVEAMETKDKGKIEVAQALARNIIKRAFSNDNMAKLVVNYVDGMPKMNVGIQAEVKTTPLSDEQLKRIARRALGLSESEGKKSSRRLSDSDKR